MHMNAAVRGAFHSVPLDGVVGLIVPGCALLYPTYETVRRRRTFSRSY
jgi:hypothetical protein